MQIKNRKIGVGNPCYIIAEMSANHSGDINKALEIVQSLSGLFKDTDVYGRYHDH